MRSKDIMQKWEVLINLRRKAVRQEKKLIPGSYLSNQVVKRVRLSYNMLVFEILQHKLSFNSAGKI